MGKRKERRLASQGNACRRVKLDLSAETPGDLGGLSIVTEEFRESFNSKQPKSPAFTDQPPQNPLQLLGTYSDDEEEVNDKSARSSSEECPQNLEAQSKVPLDVSDENPGSTSYDEDLLQLQELAAAHSGDLNDGHAIKKEGLSNFTFNASNEIEGSSNNIEVYANLQGRQWTMVLHEETNKYYYWNTETGETSWEVPPAFGNQTSATGEENKIGNVESYDVHSFDKAVHTNTNPNKATDSNTSEAFVPQKFSTSEEDLPSSLLCQSKSLLEKLKPLKSQATDDWTSIILSELRVRHSDIESLMPYGSSLLPFWVFTEKKLKTLEDVINKRIYDLAVSEQIENNDEKPDTTVNSHSLYDSEIDKEEKSHSQIIVLQKNEAVDSKAEEDIDMEVDMELEETEHAENIHCPKDRWIPPPPEDDQIPPPPPEEELVPPVPPDEHYPSHLLHQNPFVSVADPSYHGYESVYPSVYYCGTGQPVVDSSTIISAASLALYNAVPVGDALLPSEAASSSYTSTLITDCFSSSDNSNLVVIERPATSNIDVIPPVVEDPTSKASAKAPSTSNKVLRSKKRIVSVAPSVRLNKKVSSLVNKWKAAREELYSDEEEPENAYELLEKKRQRGIDEWKAKQIASGEAKDNANFQPLGGDWRDRVKRKKSENLIC